MDPPPPGAGRGVPPMELKARLTQDGTVLAETPQPSGGLVVVILLFLLAVLLAHLVIVGLGCFWAWWAGRGSTAALVGFVIVGAVEALYLTGAVASLFRGEPSYYLAAAALPLAAQVGLYLVARTRGPRAGRPGG